jgi:hypothetical protein
MAMFLYDFCPVPAPFEQSAARLLDLAPAVLADAAAAAFGRDRPGGAGVLRTGEPRRRDAALVVPIVWMAEAGGAGLFDQLDGDLQLAALEGGQSHLSLSATCARSAGDDDGRVRRQADEQVRRFLGLVASRLARADTPAR